MSLPQTIYTNFNRELGCAYVLRGHIIIKKFQATNPSEEKAMRKEARKYAYKLREMYRTGMLDDNLDDL